MTITTAMVLAAGEGRRLRPLTDRVPKPLVEVGGLPLLARTLRWLERQAFRRVVVNTHHLAGEIERWLDAHNRDFAMTIAVSHEDELLGTGGGIHRASALWEAEAAWIVNGDVVCDVDLRAAERCWGPDVDGLLVLRDDPEASVLGAVHIDEAACPVVRGLLDVGEQTGPARMFTGIHLLRRSLAATLPEPSCVVRQGYLPRIAAGRLRGHVHHGYWNEIGTPERLAAIRDDAAAGRLPW